MEYSTLCHTLLKKNAQEFQARVLAPAFEEVPHAECLWQLLVSSEKRVDVRFSQKYTLEHNTDQLEDANPKEETSNAPNLSKHIEPCVLWYLSHLHEWHIIVEKSQNHSVIYGAKVFLKAMITTCWIFSVVVLDGSLI